MPITFTKLIEIDRTGVVDINQWKYLLWLNLLMWLELFVHDFDGLGTDKRVTLTASVHVLEAAAAQPEGTDNKLYC